MTYSEAADHLRSLAMELNHTEFLGDYTIGHPCYDCGFPCYYGLNVCCYCIRPVCNDCYNERHQSSTNGVACFLPDTTNEVTT